MQNILYKVLPYIEPQQIFSLLYNKIGTIFLDSSQKHDYYGCYSFIVFDPIKIISSNRGNNLSSDLNDFEELKSDLFKERDNYEELPPFIGGLVGYLSYDLNRQLEPILGNNQNNTSKIPDYWLGLYNKVFAFDHNSKKCYLIVSNLNRLNDSRNLSELLNELEAVYNTAIKVVNDANNDISLGVVLNPTFTQTSYINMVNWAKEYILNGDIFEVNLAQKFFGKLPKSYDSRAIYNKLRSVNRAPFAAYLNLSQLQILSASPERFLKITDDNIEARPIKGTIRSSKDIKENLALKRELQSSIKDRAENIMIVDLMRNDLAKICEAGSVLVNKLCEVESFTNLHHLVSVINGRLAPGIKIFDIIKACFPGGSVTGAPKIRAMQIINELEKSPRGPYCGSIGYFSISGDIDLSVTIRTIIINQEDVDFSVGGAITLASNPLDEYQETLLKAHKLFKVLGS